MHILHGLGEGYGFESGIGNALPGAQLLGIGLSSSLVRDDGDSGADGLGTTEGNLSRESGAKSRVSGKGQLGDSFENG